MAEGNIQRVVKDSKERNLYATINNNFILDKGGLGSKGARASALQVLICLMAWAQFTGRRRVRFRSRYELLEFLGWPDSRHYYDALDEALAFWENVTFRLRWFDRKLEVRYVMEDEDEKGGTEIRKGYRRRVFDVLTVQERDRGFAVCFDRGFHRANDETEKAHFSKIYLADIKRMPRKMMLRRGSSQQILLRLVLTAMPTIYWKPTVLADKIGVKDTNLRRIRSRIKDWIADLNSYSPRKFICKPTKLGGIHIYPAKARTRGDFIEEEEYEEGFGM